MPALPPGANQPLPPSRSLQLTLSTSSGRADLVVLCVDGNGRADGDNGVALWTQPQCAGGAVTIDPAAASAVIEPDRLADGIQRVLLVAQADGVDELSQCGSLSVQVTADGAAAAALSIPSPPALPTVQLAEVYRHGSGWKVRCLGDGYQEGLARLLEVHGIEIADEQAPPQEAPAPEPVAPATKPAIRLTKGEEQLPGDMRERLSLRKEAVANAMFVKGIGDQRARVILVLDASGSMYELYPTTMRNSVERVVAVAAQLDDDGSIDAWRFASRSQQLPTLELGELPHWLEHCVLLGEAESKASKRRLGRGSRPAYPQLEKVGVRNEEHKVLRDIREYVRENPVPDPKSRAVLLRRRHLPGRQDREASDRQPGGADLLAVHRPRHGGGLRRARALRHAAGAHDRQRRVLFDRRHRADRRRRALQPDSVGVPGWLRAARTAKIF